MKIKVRVKPNAKQEKIEKVSGDSYVIWVKEKPQDGKANYAVRELLSDYLGLPKSRIILSFGEKSKEKIFTIIS